MPDINTATFGNIIIETLPAIDRNAAPLPGADPNTFMATLTAVFTAGGWPGPHQGAAGTGAGNVSNSTQPTQTASTTLLPTAALDPRTQFGNIILERLPSIDSKASPSTPEATPAAASIAPVDIFSLRSFVEFTVNF